LLNRLNRFARLRRATAAIAPIAAGIMLFGAAPILRADPPSSANLTYDWKTGDTHRYKVNAIFIGHFPPLAAPGGDPARLEVKLVYVSTVKKSDATGTDITFSVESADVAMLDKEPADYDKIDPASEIPFPIPLAQVQDVFNVTATFKPDGSITNISGGASSPIKIDVGVDIRKLFLLTMPVMFPSKSVAVNGNWTAADGIFGTGTSNITYTNTLTGVTADPKGLLFAIKQDFLSTIDDKRDKDGKPTTDAASVVSSSSGKATIAGSVNFLTGAAAQADAADHFAGHVATGKLVLNGTVTRKRTKPDPDNPDDPLSQTMDVKATFMIKCDDTAAK
jgi:hypothetical protein